MEPVHQPTRLTRKDFENVCQTKHDKFNLDSLRTIISSVNDSTFPNSPEKYQSILIDLLQFLCHNETIGMEFISLTSYAYISLLRSLYSTTDFDNKLLAFLNLQPNQVVIEFNTVHRVLNADVFKLTICSGFLQCGSQDDGHLEVYHAVFRVIYPDCIRYTRYTYVTFKLLETWMTKTRKANLWIGDTVKLEEKLEAIMFSNWDNTICRSNVISIFALYLRVMEEKYNGFLSYIFHRCVEKISWCHVTKYAILSEIYNAMDKDNLIVDSKFISNLFNSLTINYLCNASTKVYKVITKKLSEDAWKNTFGEHLKNYVITWESEKKYSIIHLLCKNWIEPVIRANKNLLPFVSQCCDEKCILYQAHLFRIAKKYGINFPLKLDPNATLLEHEEERVRLNFFAALCYEVANLDEPHLSSSVNSAKDFLYFNATTDSSFLREGIFDYFKTFLSNVLKRAHLKKDSREAVSFLEWLHEFLLDCFEIGSCYQRKIFGLQLYKITLQFLCSDCCTDVMLTKVPSFKEAIKFGPTLQKEMRDDKKWRFTDKKSVILLLKLVLDPAVDIKEISSSIIIEFFDVELITESERIALFITAHNKCNSCKFFDIDSGAYLMRILTKWYPFNVAILQTNSNFKPLLPIEVNLTWAEYLAREARLQFLEIQKDILKAATQKMPFYGMMSAFVLTQFGGKSDSHFSKKFLEELMSFITDAVAYFLNAFSLKSSNSEYSSSFEEMGLAIDEAIKSSEIDYEFDELVLSPAQQTIITCIWRSLKILCELALELAKSKESDDAIILQATELIFSVSLKCRHKGVIESAGVAIGNLVRYLSQNNKMEQELKNLLVDKLLLHDFSANLNLTRRGAGVTILFHRIIANDVRHERPLLHFSVQVLLHSLKKSASMKIEQREASNYDDPCAMRLHFLKSLVADKSLQSQLSQYLEQICLTCFDYMPSQVFVIRNASVQLFGAIVSRLVGQNTGAKSVDFGYGYSINYFATHFPQLAAHVLLSLQACCQAFDSESYRWQNSTNIIHILSLLSKMFFSGCELIDGTSITYVKQVRNCLNLFLSSSMAHVRNLAAKSLAAIVELSNINREISQLKAQIASTNNFNHLNGLLYALEYLYEKRSDEIQSTTVKHSKIRSLSEVRKNLETRSKIEALWNFWTRRSLLINQKKLCYAVEAQLLRLSNKFKVLIEENYSIDSKKKHNFDTLFEKTKPGFFDFVDELMNLFVNYISYNEDCSMIKTMLGANCEDFGTSYLKYASRHNRAQLMIVIDFAINNFEKTHQILLEDINIFANESIRNIFHGKLIELQYVDISRLKTFASKLEGAFPRTIHLSELLTSIHVLSLRGSETYDLFEDLMSCITKEKITLANYFSYPEILRELIAKGLEILLYNFNHLNSKCRVTPLLASLVLLKDEVSVIRDTVRDSISDNVVLGCKLLNGRSTDQIIYTVLLLNLVSEKSVLGDLSNDDIGEFFKKYLSTINQNTNIFNIENPFDDNNVAAYKEESKLINFIVFCIEQKVSKGLFTKEIGVYKNISNDIFYIKHDLLRKMNIDYSNLQDILDIKYDDYLSHKLKVVHEVYFEKK